jgi:hypothetical protein
MFGNLIWEEKKIIIIEGDVERGGSHVDSNWGKKGGLTLNHTRNH